MYTLIVILLHLLVRLASAALPTPGQLTQIAAEAYAKPGIKGATFSLYVPKNLAPNPAVVVAIHHCTGTPQAYYQNTPYGKASEEYGYIVIYPGSPHDDRCWDVSSNNTLTHGKGSDSEAIVRMVRWVLGNYLEVDRRRVYMVGTSSGAMMVNVLAGAYPDYFAAGIAYSGVPAGCFRNVNNGVNVWNDTCARGNATGTPEQWASVVRSMDPGYQGDRPKMLIYHGGRDTTIFPRNYVETTKQWCGVFGYDYVEAAKNHRESDGYVSTRWGPDLTGMFADDGTHDLKQLLEYDMAWFGLKSSRGSGGGPRESPREGPREGREGKEGREGPRESPRESPNPWDGGRGGERSRSGEGGSGERTRGGEQYSTTRGATATMGSDGTVTSIITTTRKSGNPNSFGSASSTSRGGDRTRGSDGGRGSDGPRETLMSRSTTTVTLRGESTGMPRSQSTITTRGESTSMPRSQSTITTTTKSQSVSTAKSESLSTLSTFSADIPSDPSKKSTAVPNHDPDSWSSDPVSTSSDSVSTSSDSEISTQPIETGTTRTEAVEKTSTPWPDVTSTQQIEPTSTRGEPEPTTEWSTSETTTTSMRGSFTPRPEITKTSDNRNRKTTTFRNGMTVTLPAAPNEFSFPTNGFGFPNFPFRSNTPSRSPNSQTGAPSFRSSNPWSSISWSAEAAWASSSPSPVINDDLKFSRTGSRKPPQFSNGSYLPVEDSAPPRSTSTSWISKTITRPLTANSLADSQPTSATSTSWVSKPVTRASTTHSLAGSFDTSGGPRSAGGSSTTIPNQSASNEARSSNVALVGR